jgi:hypothetical protein
VRCARSARSAGSRATRAAKKIRRVSRTWSSLLPAPASMKTSHVRLRKSAALDLRANSGSQSLVVISRALEDV